LGRGGAIFNSYSDTHGHPNFYAYRNADPDPNADPNAYSDGNANSYADADGHSDCNADSYADCDSARVCIWRQAVANRLYLLFTDVGSNQRQVPIAG
jgi:hypothetical protein